jgi:Spy/CpxP family protein refolding chaperone
MHKLPSGFAAPLPKSLEILVKAGKERGSAETMETEPPKRHAVVTLDELLPRLTNSLPCGEAESLLIEGQSCRAVCYRSPKGKWRQQHEQPGSIRELQNIPHGENDFRCGHGLHDRTRHSGLQLDAGGPPPGGPGGHWQPPTAEDQTARLTKALNLSEEQQGRVKAILEEQHQQMAKMREDSSTAPEDRFAKMKEMREKVHNQIKDVLNEDQKKKFAEWEQQRSDRMRHRRESAPDDKDKAKGKDDKD